MRGHCWTQKTLICAGSANQFVMDVMWTYCGLTMDEPWTRRIVSRSIGAAQALTVALGHPEAKGLLQANTHSSPQAGTDEFVHLKLLCAFFMSPIIKLCPTWMAYPAV